jgi:hypothetical protein
MDKYHNIKKQSVQFNFKKVSKAKIENELIFESVPQDYIEFLLEVGYGTVRNDNFIFYEGLINASEVFNEADNPGLKNILLFGDNFSGDAIGFLHTDWSIVEIWHQDVSIVPRDERTFMEFANNIFKAK